MTCLCRQSVNPENLSFFCILSERVCVTQFQHTLYLPLLLLLSLTEIINLNHHHHSRIVSYSIPPSSDTAYIAKVNLTTFNPVEFIDIFAMANQDPKVVLLRQKLALVAGPNECSMYNTITRQNPNALHEPWSTTMTESPKYVGTLVILRG